MTKIVDFYFDFVSPYSFLAHKRIRKIENEEKIKFIYKPILLGGLHNLIGITAPAFINPKAKFMVRDCKMVANKFNIKFIFNSENESKNIPKRKGDAWLGDTRGQEYLFKVPIMKNLAYLVS